MEFHFAQKVPTELRNERFERELQRCLTPYREVLEELQNKGTPTSKTNSSRLVNEEISSDENF